MILETIVSTIGQDGKPNFAPMGARVDNNRQWSLVVYHGSRTYSSLRSTGSCVINLVSDVRLFVLTALYDHTPPHKAAARVKGAIIDMADEAMEFEVEREMDIDGKTEFTGRIIKKIMVRTPAPGYCRAHGAVIEALIAVTRKNVLPDSRIENQLDQSRVIVGKTGSLEEQEAMALIDKYLGGHG